MSFATFKERIQHGDTVILHLGFNRLMAIKVKRGNTFQTRFGALRHDDVIGKKFGHKVPCSKGWVHVLQPTPELWTVTLPHRTQILYSTDISMIILQLDLKPGSVIVEAGTGSGSLSHAILRAITPSGHLHTFDFHEQRTESAREEFEDHGLGELVTSRHRDVCKDGFDLNNTADAVFLDLPAPWEALPHAKQAIKTSGGRLCSFSPCIEQVQRTCQTMRALGFCDIETMECLLREHNIVTMASTVPRMVGWTGKVEDTPGCGPLLGYNSKEPLVGIYDKAGENSKDAEPDLFPQDCKMDKPFMFRCKVAAPCKSMQGHTGYLTFASSMPEFLEYDTVH